MPSTGPTIEDLTYSRTREVLLSVASRALARTKRPLWYLETLVLSARYNQALQSSAWGNSSRRFRNRETMWQSLVVPQLARRPRWSALEFGVAAGAATRWYAANGVNISQWHGFDTFSGLPEPWRRGSIDVVAAGAFSPESSSSGVPPKISAHYPISWHPGLIEDTLPSFSRPEGAVFILIDVDLLNPTRTIFQWLIEHGEPGDLIYLDEAFDPFNEGLALEETIRSGLRVEALGNTGTALLLRLQG